MSSGGDRTDGTRGKHGCNKEHSKKQAWNRELGKFLGKVSDS